MSYYFTRFMFLFSIACVLVGTGYTLVALVSVDAHEASRSLAITVTMLFVALVSRFESSDEYIPEYQPKYLTK